MDILNVIDNTLGRFLYLGINIVMIAIPIFIIFKAIQLFKLLFNHLEQKQTPGEREELEFHRTTTEIENRLQWDKEKELIRKSNEILLHLIQDEHREDRDH